MSEDVPVLYLCDRRACEQRNEPCHHTPDVKHAKNFEVAEDGSVWEHPNPLLIFKMDVLFKADDMNCIRQELLGQVDQGLILCGPIISIEGENSYTMYDVTITKRKVE